MLNQLPQLRPARSEGRTCSWLRDVAPRVRDSSWFLGLVVVIVFAAAVRFQEKILPCHGFGHDGCLYGYWAMDFPGTVLTSGVSDYYAFRVLPSFVAYWVLRLLSCAHSVPNVITTFNVMNGVMMFITAVAFSSMAKKLQVSAWVRWVGAIGFFGSYAILKWLPFYAVLTDGWALGLGALQMHAYLSRRPLGLAGITALGAFAWPTLLPVGVALLFCLAMDKRASSISRPAWLHLNDLVAAAATAYWLKCCRDVIVKDLDQHYGTEPIVMPVVRLSVLISAALLFWVMRSLLNDRRLFDPRLYLRAVFTVPGVLGVVIWFGARYVRQRLSDGKPGLQSGDVLVGTVIQAIAMPGNFILSHVLFFGPLLLVLILRWSQFCDLLRSHKLGPSVVTLLTIPVFMQSESRKLLNFAPMLFPFVLLVLDRLDAPRRKMAWMAAISLFSSKVWLTLEGSLAGAQTQFPPQLFFMTCGPWISYSMYVVQGLVVLAVVGWVASWLPRKPGAREQQTV